MGGSSGSRSLSAAAFTSLAKSASIVAVESSGSNATHSEMDRRGGTGAWIADAGSLPLSITTSAPVRTRASSPWKSLAASASAHPEISGIYNTSMIGLPWAKTGEKPSSDPSVGARPVDSIGWSTILPHEVRQRMQRFVANGLPNARAEGILGIRAPLQTAGQ